VAVAFEPGEVGDVRGKRLLHLMCHIGLDSLSWARRGHIPADQFQIPLMFSLRAAKDP
jgi:hypothetical protein